MVRLLVPSAPGVWLIVDRLTTLVLVEDSGLTLGDRSCTSTVAAACATTNEKCGFASRPEVRPNVCSSVAKPAISTRTRYSPSGTLSKSNSPAASLVADCVQSEVVERKLTVAPCTGRCCGS